MNFGGAFGATTTRPPPASSLYKGPANNTTPSGREAPSTTTSSTPRPVADSSEENRIEPTRRSVIMVADLSVDMLSNDTVSSFEKGKVQGASLTKPPPSDTTEKASGSDEASPAAARGRGRAMRRSSVNNKPPEFLPLRLDREIRSKSLGRVLRKDRGGHLTDEAATKDTAPEEQIAPPSGKSTDANINKSDPKPSMAPNATATIGFDSFASPTKASNRTIGSQFKSPSKTSPAKSPKWAHVSLKSDDYLPLRSPLNRASDLNDSDSHLLNESSSETTMETSPPASPDKRSTNLSTAAVNDKVVDEEPQPIDGQQRPMTVRGMSFDDVDPVCLARGNESGDGDNHRIDSSSGHGPVKRPTTVRGHSFDTLPDECPKPSDETKSPSRGKEAGKSPKRKARKGKPTKKGKVNVPEPEPTPAPAVELSPGADSGPMSPSKVRPLKVRTLPVEAELLGLSELELDESPAKPEDPQQSEPVAVLPEKKKTTSKSQAKGKSHVPTVASPKPAAPNEATTGKARFGRKPRPQEASSSIQNDADDDSNCEVRIELVKEDEDDLEGIKEAPRLAVNHIRPAMVRGMSFSDDAPLDLPTEASKPTRPRGGRKARPSGNTTTNKPAEEKSTLQPAVDESKDGLLKPVPKVSVVTDEAPEKEPEWAKPKLKSASKCDPTEKEKQIAWSKPTWSINRSRDLQHPKQSDDDATDVSESVTEPQE